jgi:hypothetical protein
MAREAVVKDIIRRNLERMRIGASSGELKWLAQGIGAFHEA